jgi:hypothetical protein
MSREEINELLLVELPEAKQSNVLSDALKSLFYVICRRTVESDRYKFLNDDRKYDCVLNAYEACTKHAIKFNPEKSNDAYSYVNIIIRSSIAGTIIKLKKS